MFGKVSHWRDNSDDVSLELWRNLKKEYPEQLDRVMSHPECELEPSFLGFVNTYEKLSWLIPFDTTIIDFGCHSAAQAYYFREHKAYIGVDQYSIEYRFKFSNTIHHKMSIQDYIDSHSGMLENNTFAISNYVAQNYSCQTDKLISDTYPNHYIYYPGR